jgi:hypothetical protein
MNVKKIVSSVVTVIALLTLVPALSFADKKILSGDEIKALITGKTVFVTRQNDGAQWKVYYTADGKTLSSESGAGTWEVKDGKHCNSGVKLKCAQVTDLGDGTYARLKPNGDVAVTWTKIVDGKDI